MKLFILITFSVLFISCSSSNYSYKYPYKNYLESIREQNRTLSKIDGIDTLSIGFIKQYMSIVNKRDSVNQEKGYEITFLTENFEALNQSTKENILSFLFINNFTINFLANNYELNQFHKGFGLMDYIFFDDTKFGYPYLTLRIMLAPMEGNGYDCQLEKIGNEYKIKNVNFTKIY